MSESEASVTPPPVEPIEIQVVSPLRSDTLNLKVSPKELVNTVRQHLLALGPLVQPANSFVLECDGKEVDLTSTVDSLQSRTLKISLRPLTKAAVIAQVESVREMLGFVEPQDALSLGPTNLNQIISSTQTSGEVKTPTANSGVVEYAQAQPNEPKRLAKQLEFSAWNPVRPQYAIQGHLGYLRFVSFDSKVRHIVATTQGFAHVPQLTEDHWPSSSEWPASGYEHSLHDLIGKLSSATYNQVRRTAKLLKAQDPHSWVPVKQVFSQVPWYVASPDSPVSHAYTTGLPQSADAKDFNEDFQSTRELPKDNITERASRDRMLMDVTASFAAAASQGARDILDGTLLPLNSEEPRDAHIFIRNGVFYTYGADFSGAFADFGGDEAARVAAKKDMTGAEQLMHLDIDELCPVVTSVIDIAGRRIVAQAPVPGVFRETGESQVIYGATEGREEVLNDKKMGELFAKVAKTLHLKPHDVMNVNLETSVDVRGMKGTDGRLYALDLYRLSPPDLSFDTTNYPHKMVLLRPEAVAEYYRQNPEAPAVNPDGWMPDASKADKEHILKICDFVNTQIKDYVDAIVDNKTTYPIDGTQLAQSVHRRGINLRYLGKIHELAVAKNSKFLANFIQVIELEIATRAAKHLLGAKLRSLEFHDVPAAIADFFVNPPLKKIEHESAIRFPGIKFKTTVAFDTNMVRSLSLKTGLQWTRPAPTSVHDLASIQCVTKFASPRSLLADEALEASLATGDANVVAESVSIYSQIYGAVHPEVARALNQAALSFYNAENFSRAVELERRAVIVAERTMGLDNAETIVMYTNLTVFERAAGSIAIAMEISNYVLSLWNSVALPLHPEVASTYDSIGVLLQQLKQFSESIKWLEGALKLLEASGAPAVLAAPVHYKLSQSLLMTQQYELSTRHMEQAYNGYKAAGETDLTAECKSWLDKLLQATIRAPKILEAAKQHQLKPKIVEAPKKIPTARGDDKKRSVDDIVAYIMGDSEGKPKKNKSKAQKKNGTPSIIVESNGSKNNSKANKKN